MGNAIERENVKGKRCETCYREISGYSLKAAGKYYHEGCLQCYECRRALSGTYYKLKHSNHPHCGECARRHLGPCHACGSLLDDKYLEAHGHNYHKRCFRCTYCHKELGSSYMMKDSHVSCKDCASKPTHSVSTTSYSRAPPSPRSGGSSYSSTTTTHHPPAHPSSSHSHSTHHPPASSSHTYVHHTPAPATKTTSYSSSSTAPRSPAKITTTTTTTTYSTPAPAVGGRPKFCAMCGKSTAAMPASAHFCAFCGAKLVA